MAVENKSGASADLWTIDPISKAGRVTIYDVAGLPIMRNTVFRGAAEIEVKQSTTTGSGAVVWALHNPHASKVLYLQRVALRCFFDGVAAATLMKYELIKATGVTTFSGGTLVTPVTKKTGESAVGVVRVLDTGLTTTGITNVQVLGNVVHGRVTQTATNFQSTTELFDFASLLSDPVFLAQFEMLAIRQTVASVTADNIIGTTEWNEA